jgi:predicted nucleic acid-binding protein
MKIIVDTNVLFSFFWKNSITKKILSTSNFELISPILALEELKKYSEEIIKKTKIIKEQFNQEFSNLQKIVSFIDKNQYSFFLEEAEKIAPDKLDSHFFALCLKFNCFLWSNDFILKRQDKIKVFSTEEIIELLF